jgi:hypothetical protein
VIRLLAHLSTRTVYGPVQIEPPMGKATATTVLVGFFHRSNNRFIVNSASLSIWSLANGQCDAPLVERLGTPTSGFASSSAW